MRPDPRCVEAALEVARQLVVAGDPDARAWTEALLDRARERDVSDEELVTLEERRRSLTEG